VLAVSTDGQSVAIDFSDELWTIGTENLIAPDNIVGRQELTDQVFDSLGGNPIGEPSNIRTGMQWLWEDDTSSVIDRIVFAAKDEALNTTIPDRSTSSDKVSLFAAPGTDDTITGSHDNDFIFGGDGDDVLLGADGNDLLASGTGDDRLNGGDGHNFLVGGDGTDTVFYEGPAAKAALCLAAVPDSAERRGYIS
jgi:Ca2+-binding RTX toxin-like protein